MILPIVAYGDLSLRRPTREIEPSHPNLAELIQNMWDTMYQASGVGLAAPQVGESIRLFVVDGASFADEDPKLRHFKHVFINPEILEEDGKKWGFSEGCLSIPGIRENVQRQARVLLAWDNEQFEPQEAWFDGLAARIIQHEYDHLEGILFTDHLGPLRKKLLKSKLERISRGQVQADYRMSFPKK
jgi:peptide deformylase